MHFNLFVLHLTFKNGENLIIIMEINIRKTLNTLRSEPTPQRFENGWHESDDKNPLPRKTLYKKETHSGL